MLTPTAWQPVRPLDVALVALLEDRVQSGRVERQQLAERAAPADPRPSRERPGELRLSCRAALQAAQDPAAGIVDGCRGGGEVEDRLLDTCLRWQPRWMRSRASTAAAMHHDSGSPPDLALVRHRDVDDVPGRIDQPGTLGCREVTEHRAFSAMQDRCPQERRARRRPGECRVHTRVQPLPPAGQDLRARATAVDAEACQLGVRHNPVLDVDQLA